MADENKPEKKKKAFGVTFKVSAKGAVSVYGLGRFPVTLYREQWVRLLERSDDLRKFMEEHAEELKAKGDQSAAATPDAAEGAPIVGSAGPGTGGGAAGGESGAGGGLGPQGSAVGAEATEVARTVDEAGAPSLVGGSEGTTTGGSGTGGGASGGAGSTSAGAVWGAGVEGGRAAGGGEAGAPARDAEGALTPGNENVAQEPDRSYHDDYPVGDKPTDPWRPGQAPGVDGVREGEIRGVRDSDVDRDEI